VESSGHAEKVRVVQSANDSVRLRLCCNDENVDPTAPMLHVESRRPIIQLAHELHELIRRMNGMSIHVQNDIAALQTHIRCPRSDSDLHHHHSVFSR
jgi:hypothetical protein